MGVAEVYARDLNGDSTTDFIVELVNGGFNGLSSDLTQVLVILPRSEGCPVVHMFWTYGDIADDFVALDQDGCIEVIITDLQQASTTGLDHSYWIHDRYELNCTNLIPVRTNDWPVWVWFSKEENHQNSTHFSRAEKDAMWTEWLGGKTSVVETVELEEWQQ